MSLFVFFAFNIDQNKHTYGFIVAQHQQDACLILQKKHCNVTKIYTMPSFILKFSPHRIQNTRMIFLYLSYFSRMNTPFLNALNHIALYFKGMDAWVVKCMADNVYLGMCLSEAMQLCTPFFDARIISRVKMGEMRGKMTEAFQEIETDLGKTYMQRQKILKMTRYPLYMCAILTVALCVLMNFFIPPFIEMMREQNITHSISTQILIQAYYFSWHVFFLYGAIMCCLFHVICRYFFKQAHVWKKIYIHIPMIGTLWLQEMYYCFFKRLADLMSDKISFMQAFHLSRSEIPSTYIKNCMNKVHKRIIQGDSFHQALAMMPKLNPIYMHLIQSGELNGHMSHALQHVSHMMQDDIHILNERYIQKIEPISLMIVGGILLFLLHATFISLYQNMGEFGV